MKLVTLTEFLHHFAHVLNSTMKMKLNFVNHVHTIVQIVPTQLIVTFVQKTESIYHSVPVHKELMMLKDKLSVQLVNSHVLPVPEIPSIV